MAVMCGCSSTTAEVMAMNRLERVERVFVWLAIAAAVAFVGGGVITQAVMEVLGNVG